MPNDLHRHAASNSKLSWVIYIAALGALAVIYYLHNATYSVDDSFITYRYAFNLMEGNGLVFNVGERYYGTTAAGYAILLASMTWLLQHVGALLGSGHLATIDVPQVSVIVSALALANIGLLIPVLLRPGKNILKWGICLGSATALIIAYPFNEVAGHETYTFLASVLSASILLFVANRPALAAILFAVAASFRPDAALAAVAALLVDWQLAGSNLKNYLQDHRTQIFVGVFGLLMIVWLGSLAYYFGSPVPGTMAAKKVQVALGYWPLYSVPVVAKYTINAFGFAGAAFVGLGLLFLILAFDTLRKNLLRINRGAIASLITVGLFGLMSAIGYLLLNVTFWQWYGVPVVFSLLSAGAAGWLVAIDRSEYFSDLIGAKNKGAGIALLSAPIVILALLSAATLIGYRTWAHTRNNNEHIRAYTEIADFIKAEKPNGAVVQMFEPGSFAYRLGSKYRVVDELGLITPGVAQALKRGDKEFLLNRENPDYLVCSWKGSFSVCDTDLMRSHFEYVGSFNKAFWQPHLGGGARLFRAKNYAAQQNTAQEHATTVIERISNIVLGDKWGLVRKTDDPTVVFVHPGETNETTFDYQCKTTCEEVIIGGRISDLPPAAGPDAGDVTIAVSGLTGSPIKRIPVTRDKPASFEKIAVPADGKLHFSVSNNGNPSFDWLLLTVIDGNSDVTQ